MTEQQVPESEDQHLDCQHLFVGPEELALELKMDALLAAQSELKELTEQMKGWRPVLPLVDETPAPTAKKRATWDSEYDEIKFTIAEVASFEL